MSIRLVMRDVTDRSWPLLLERVCAENLVVPVFQPIIDLVRGVACGYEALARIITEDDSVDPKRWFDAAAWHGYSGRLEAAAVNAVLDQRRTLPENAFLSINVSPEALLGEPVLTLLTDEADLTGVVIEVTEQTPVEDYRELGGLLYEVRERGGMVAVAGAGTGYTSLRHLIELRPQFVKIGKALVEGIHREPQQAVAVAAIGALAEKLDAWLIAEGVEQVDELERLVDLGVPLAQGYLLGEPEAAPGQPAPHIELRIRALQRAGGDPLSALARPAPTVCEEPEVVGETMVLVDEQRRPRRVLVPAGGRRTNHHPAMCIQREDDIQDVALRAAARQSEDRYGPLCLCNEDGGLEGIILIEALLDALARRSRVRPSFT